MLGRTDRRLRILVVLLIFACFGVAAVARLGYWQVARGQELTEQAMSQLERPVQEPAVRGTILDRNGVVLATTEYRDTLSAYPNQINLAAVPVMVDVLAPILSLDGAGRRDLTAQLSSKAAYVVVARELTPDQSSRVQAALDTGTLADLSLQPHSVRVYPNPGGAPGTTLASQLLGFVTADGVGRYGIEQEYDKVLAGKPKVVSAARDAGGQPLESTAQVIDPGQDGLAVKLTIDASLQLQLEKELYAAWVADRSKEVSGLVMDPHNGQVLAWASVPGYDANNFSDTASTNPTLLQDPIVSQMYEPGSVMKMFTAAAAIGSGEVTPSSKVKDAVSLTFGSQTLHNSDHKSMGWLPFQDAVAYSRNIALAGVAMKLGHGVAKSASTLYATWKELGIGQPTGVDLAGEATGIAPDPAQQIWQPVDLADRAFGQSVAVTAVQLAAGFTPMINGGMHVQPHFLAAIGGQAQADPQPQRVIGASLASQLQGILHHVTASVPWYAEGSLIRGYNVGGKTGTAQMWDAQKGSYSYNTFNFTFCGYVGGSAPQAVIVVRIGEASPRVIMQGDLELGITSYQLFRRVAVDTIATLGIPRLSDPTAGMPEPRSAAEKAMYPALWAKHQSTGTTKHKAPSPAPGTHHGAHATPAAGGGLQRTTNGPGGGMGPQPPPPPQQGPSPTPSR